MAPKAASKRTAKRSEPEPDWRVALVNKLAPLVRTKLFREYMMPLLAIDSWKPLGFTLSGPAGSIGMVDGKLVVTARDKKKVAAVEDDMIFVVAQCVMAVADAAWAEAFEATALRIVLEEPEEDAAIYDKLAKTFLPDGVRITVVGEVDDDPDSGSEPEPEKKPEVVELSADDE